MVSEQYNYKLTRFQEEPHEKQEDFIMGLNSKMANREVQKLIFKDYGTKKPFLNLDFANTSTTELTGETMFAYGGHGHPKRVSFAGEKGGTLTIETQMQSVKLWELITGGDVSKSAKYTKRVVLTAAEGKVTLPETPAAGIEANFYLEDDDCGKELTAAVSGMEVTLTDVAEGASVVAYYTKEVEEKVERINIKSTSFPKAFVVEGETYMKTEDDDILPARMIAYKCVPQSTMSLAFANNGEPGAVTITCDLLADKDNNILDLIVEEE